MNPMPRPMVLTAATVLGGVCLLGLYLGIHGSLSRPYGAEASTTAASSSEAALKPGMAPAAEATPLKTEALPASAAPAQMAEAAPSAAKPRPKADQADDQSDSEAVPASSAPHAPPPDFYPPDEPPAPPPANEGNAPPY